MDNVDGMMIRYRSEIDGLRALAILSVLFYHAGFGFIPGGFVGVDIFFVISGFLITSIILKETREGTFSYAGFYERRIRRLLPPVIPVIAFCFLFSFFLLNPDQFSSFVSSCYAIVLFVGNWFFLSAVDYFGGPGDLTPLLHAWSLAVEEQFYFIFPFFLVLLASRPKSIRYVFCASVLLLSLGYSVYLLSQGETEAAFYNSFARFWELMIGAMLAVWNPSKPNQVKADLCEVAGVSFIAYAFIFYNAQTIFPGLSALLPTVGAALLIYAAGNGRFISKLLKSKPMVLVGLVSYSLYLWHWPIIVFTKLVKPGAGAILMVAGLVVSLILAILSYKLVERPFRMKTVAKSTGASFAFAILFMASITSVALALSYTKVEERRVELFAKVRSMLFDGDKLAVVATIDAENKFYMNNLNVNYFGNMPEYNQGAYAGFTCSYDRGNTVDRIFACVKAQMKERNVLVLGDSIGRDTMHSLRRVYPELNFIMIHQSSCPPGDVGGRCFRQLRELLAKVGGELKFEAVVINFRYRPKEWKDVESGIDAAKQVSSNVLMFGVSPMYAQKTSDYIKSLPESSPIPVFIAADDKGLTQWSYAELAEQAKAMAEKHHVTFVPVLEFFCPSAKCRMWVDNRPGNPLFIDEQHLTNKGMDEFGSYLKKQGAVNSLL